LDQVAGIRAAHDDYVSRFSQLVNEVRLARAERKAGAPDQVPLPMARETVATVLQGVQLMSDWAGRILQQAAWKYANPNMDKSIQTEIDYERAIKYNYKSEERSALVEVIAMCKGMARLVLKHDTFLSPVIRAAIHAELQEFV
jgi:cytoplasmic FMR1 interacting protein